MPDFEVVIVRTYRETICDVDTPQEAIEQAWQEIYDDPAYSESDTITVNGVQYKIVSEDTDA